MSFLQSVPLSFLQSSLSPYPYPPSRSLCHPNIIQYKAFRVAEDGVHALMMEHGQQSLFDRFSMTVAVTMTLFLKTWPL